MGPLSNLPTEIIEHILLYLSGKDLCHFGAVSKGCYDLAKQEHLWRKISPKWILDNPFTKGFERYQLYWSGRLQCDANAHSLQLKKDVTAIALDIDGKSIALGSSDRSIRIYNDKGHCQSVLSNHLHAITALCFSPSHHCLISSSTDQVTMWDTISDQLSNSNLTEITNILCSPSGTYTLGTTQGGSLHLWDRDGTGLGGQEHTAPLTVAIFSPDENFLVSASLAKPGLFIWNIQAKQYQKSLYDLNTTFSTATYFDDVHLFSGTNDGKLYVWNVQTEHFLCIDEFAGKIVKIDFNENYYFVLTDQGYLSIRNLEMHQALNLIPECQDACFLPDNRVLYAGPDVGIYDIARQASQEFSRENLSPIQKLAALSHHAVFSLSEDQSVCLWKLPESTESPQEDDSQ